MLADILLHPRPVYIQIIDNIVRWKQIISQSNIMYLGRFCLSILFDTWPYLFLLTVMWYFYTWHLSQWSTNLHTETYFIHYGLNQSWNLTLWLRYFSQMKNEWNRKLAQQNILHNDVNYFMSYCHLQSTINCDYFACFAFLLTQLERKCSIGRRRQTHHDDVT